MEIAEAFCEIVIILGSPGVTVQSAESFFLLDPPLFIWLTLYLLHWIWPDCWVLYMMLLIFHRYGGKKRGTEKQNKNGSSTDNE